MNIKQLSPTELKAKQAQGHVILLDVREPHEHARYHLTDLLIPLGELPRRISELQEYRSQPLIVYCEHGVRSLYAAQFLSDSGFNEVYSLQGGMAAYLSSDQSI